MPVWRRTDSVTCASAWQQSSLLRARLLRLPYHRTSKSSPAAPTNPALPSSSQRRHSINERRNDQQVKQLIQHRHTPANRRTDVTITHCCLTPASYQLIITRFSLREESAYGKRYHPISIHPAFSGHGNGSPLPNRYQRCLFLLLVLRLIHFTTNHH